MDLLEISVRLLLTLFLCARGVYTATHHPSRSNKLLYFMLDGFRYDYTDSLPADKLPGFTKFFEEGVRAKWSSPIFPSVSYPSWTTLSTGLYAEDHGIVGNYFYDAEEKNSFELYNSSSTGNKKWWTAEPIWATATKQGRRTASHLWSRCDIDFGPASKPEICNPFYETNDHKIFKQNFEKAIDNFKDGFDFVLVYSELIDTVGHAAGPETEALRQELMFIDEELLHLQKRLEEEDLDDEVNIIIVSDHGMVDASNFTRIPVNDYLNADLVEKITESGAYMNIKTLEGNTDKVYEHLKHIRGADVYKHRDIPHEYHYKNHKYIHDIVVIAKPGNLILPSTSNKQMPIAKDPFTDPGVHGYTSAEEKMRGIFFAKGPDFKQNHTIEGINLVDVYQVVAHVLNVMPNEHRGKWNDVKEAFIKETSSCTTPHPVDLLVVSLLSILLRI